MDSLHGPILLAGTKHRELHRQVKEFPDCVDGGLGNSGLSPAILRCERLALQVLASFQLPAVQLRSVIPPPPELARLLVTTANNPPS